MIFQLVQFVDSFIRDNHEQVAWAVVAYCLMSFMLKILFKFSDTLLVACNAYWRWKYKQVASTALLLFVLALAIMTALPRVNSQVDNVFSQRVLTLVRPKNSLHSISDQISVSAGILNYEDKISVALANFHSLQHATFIARSISSKLLISVTLGCPVWIEKTSVNRHRRFNRVSELPLLRRNRPYCHSSPALQSKGLGDNSSPFIDGHGFRLNGNQFSFSGFRLVLVYRHKYPDGYKTENKYEGYNKRPSWATPNSPFDNWLRASTVTTVRHLSRYFLTTINAQAGWSSCAQSGQIICQPILAVNLKDERASACT